MKGIREAAMSQEEETKPAKSYGKDSLFDSDRYDGSYYGSEYGGYSGQSYKPYSVTPPISGLITISMSIPASDLGPIADDTHPQYSWNKAQIKAEEIAYDRIEELLGKNYESKYSLGFDISDSYDEYEVTVTLTPTKK